MSSPSMHGDVAARVVLTRIAEPGDPLLAAAVAELGAERTVDGVRTGSLRHPWSARYAARLATVDVGDLLRAARPPGVDLLVPSDACWPRRFAELDHLDGQA